MKKKIGILMPSINSGGVFQLASSIFEAISSFSQFQCSKIIVEERNFLKKIISPFFQNHNKEFDLIIFPTPFSFCFPRKIPFIIFIPDLMHRYYPSFPEYGLKQRITRDMVYKHYLKRSILNLVDSQQGADDLNKFFGIERERIRIIPYIPASYVFKYKNMEKEAIEDLLKKYNIPDKFIFYPAQLWYHKNHARLIKALSLIKKQKKITIPLVLVGSLAGRYYKRYKKIRSLIKDLDMEDQVFHLNYVSDKEIVALYKKSVALVFPTLLGPTNIPPLEAMILGTPIICSNLFEMPKQIGKAGILFNPFKEEDMAEKIYRVWQEQGLKEKLIKYGQKKAETLTLNSYANNWEEVIEKALQKKEL